MQFDRMRQWTRDLIAIDSVTGREADLASYLVRQLPARGWTISELPVAGSRRNLLASFDTSQPRICFNTHLDTVPEAYGPHEDTERLYGRGACDTKGILAAMLEALEDARTDGVEGLGLLLVVGEETDHVGAIAAGDQMLEPEVLVVGEPTENKFLRAQKGLLTARLSAGGVEGHSGYPEVCDSAVDRLLPALEVLRAADWLRGHSDEGTTLNISLLSGGEALNKVPGLASASLMYRLTEPVSVIMARVEELLAPFEVRVQDNEVDAPGLADPGQLVLDWHRAAVSDPVDPIDVLPGHPCGVAAFGTDLPYFGWQPRARYLVGPGSILQAHKDPVGGDRMRGEWIDKNAQEDGARLYRELIRRVAADPVIS
ncbi:MAG: M20/M25/M40 family metallo-hydrolase [Planctomycetes bacterium]|nr:M20/M25/M40 family metallo-hydrolase [Planctomycetota bacterium]